jgi:Arc/MetJ-type ribon-helix-helix transcriptional regulator
MNWWIFGLKRSHGHTPSEERGRVMTIDVSESLMEIIRRRVAEGAYGSAETYIESLVRDDEQRQARVAQGIIGLSDHDRERIRALLVESLQPGTAMSVESFLRENSLERN